MPAYPRSFRGLPVAEFGHPGTDLRRELVELVMAGTKTATAGLLAEYELDGDPIPAPGMREVVVDEQGRFVGEIETTRCEVVRMADVDDRFAREEGEGFADAADWRTAHERFWNAYLGELQARLGDPGWALTDDTLVVCQRMRVVARYPEPITAAV
jgi:uncharacterized protein YhfF